MITIREEQLLNLLEEAYPHVVAATKWSRWNDPYGGSAEAMVAGKIAAILEASGRVVPTTEEEES